MLSQEKIDPADEGQHQGQATHQVEEDDEPAPTAYYGSDLRPGILREGTLPLGAQQLIIGLLGAPFRLFPDKVCGQRQQEAQNEEKPGLGRVQVLSPRCCHSARSSP